MGSDPVTGSDPVIVHTEEQCILGTLGPFFCMKILDKIKMSK